MTVKPVPGLAIHFQTLMEKKFAERAKHMSELLGELNVTMKRIDGGRYELANISGIVSFSGTWSLDEIEASYEHAVIQLARR